MIILTYIAVGVLLAFLVTLGVTFYQLGNIIELDEEHDRI